MLSLAEVLRHFLPIEVYCVGAHYCEHGSRTSRMASQSLL